MKVLVLAGALAAVVFPSVAAADVMDTCRTQDTDASTGLGVDRAETTSAPAQPAPSRATAVSPRAVNEARAEAQRRRSGRRVPDAELIGPRGAL